MGSSRSLSRAMERAQELIGEWHLALGRVVAVKERLVDGPPQLPLLVAALPPVRPVGEDGAQLGRQRLDAGYVVTAQEQQRPEAFRREVALAAPGDVARGARLPTQARRPRRPARG